MHVQKIFFDPPEEKGATLTHAPVMTVADTERNADDTPQTPEGL